MSTTLSPAQPEEKDLPIEGVIAIACLCGLIITVLIIVLLCVLRRRKQGKVERDYELEGQAGGRAQPLTQIKDTNRTRQGYNNTTQQETQQSAAPYDIHNQDLGVLPGDEGTSYLTAESEEVVSFNRDPHPHNEGRVAVIPQQFRYETSNNQDALLSDTIQQQCPQNEQFSAPLNRYSQNLNAVNGAPSPVFMDQQASFQTDQSRGHGSGYSTPEPSKPTKIIYEVVV